MASLTITLYNATFAFTGKDGQNVSDLIQI